MAWLLVDDKRDKKKFLNSIDNTGTQAGTGRDVGRGAWGARRRSPPPHRRSRKAILLWTRVTLAGK